MRCDCCPLADPEDSCPESEGEYGLEHRDGVCGCKHPKNWIKKRDAEYSESIYWMGLDMGIEMRLSPDELTRAIEICKHMVGLDYKHPYHRHGKAFYKAYRNFYGDLPEGNKFWTSFQKNCFLSIEMSVGQHITLPRMGLIG